MSNNKDYDVIFNVGETLINDKLNIEGFYKRAWRTKCGCSIIELQSDSVKPVNKFSCEHGVSVGTEGNCGLINGSGFKSKYGLKCYRHKTNRLARGRVYQKPFSDMLIYQSTKGVKKEVDETFFDHFIEITELDLTVLDWEEEDINFAKNK